MRRWVLAGSGAIVVAVVAAWAVFASLTPAAMTGVIVAARNVALTVSNQSTPAGSLRIDEVRVPSASWVVVSTLGTAASAPSIVGTLSIPAGQSRDVTVTLGPGLRLNQKLQVTLYADHGIVGTFEFDQARFDASPDKPYFADGVMVSATLVRDVRVLALAEASGVGAADEIPADPGTAVLDVADRLTVIDSLVVDRVVAPAPSFVVVYIVDESGRPTRAAGMLAVPTGEQTNVPVPISVDSVLGDKLLVVLQADLGTPGVLDFALSRFSASTDRPYAVSGAEVSRPVQLRGYGMGQDNTAGEGGGM